ncbi:hypothetical protein [Halospeciosus flavus]
MAVPNRAVAPASGRRTEKVHPTQVTRPSRPATTPRVASSRRA